MLESDRDFATAVIRSGLISPDAMADVLYRWARSRASSPLAREFVDRGLLDVDQTRALQRRAQRARQEVEFLPPGAERYVDEKSLGRGGMGVVRQVRDRYLNRSVALKQIRPDKRIDPELVGALLTEARVAGMLEHPNIMPVYDVGLLPTGEPYYTMRLMDTQSLEDIITMLRKGNPEARRAYPLRRLLRIFLAVCRAVDYAHGQGVVHRDIKPENVRLGAYGEVQLADWGLARVQGHPDLPLRRALEAAHATGQVDPCIVIGSPNYMSPEQAAGRNDEVDEASDIWALGAVLYEVLTYEPPYAAADTMVLLEQVEREPLVPPSERSPDRRIPQALESICVGVLQKNKLDRPLDVRVLARSIERFLEGDHDRRVADARAFEEVTRGQRYAEAYFRLREAIGRLVTTAQSAQPPLRGELEHELSRLEVDLGSAFGFAWDAYTQALAFDSDHLVARARLAELSWNRVLDSERRGDDVGCQFFFAMLSRYNDGAFDTYLSGTGRIDIRTAPTGATVYLKRYQPDALDELDGVGRAVGRAPQTVELGAGLYLLTVTYTDESGRGRRKARPVFVRARHARHLTLEL